MATLFVSGSLQRYVSRLAATILVAGLLGVFPSLGRAETTLRVVMASDLKIIDPIWTSAYIVREHGYLIYDTLFSIDANGEVQPQMVGRYEISPDKLTHTMTLREGLAWHDGTAVTAEDCVASIRRWAFKDSNGQLLMAITEELSAKDEITIVFKLKSPSTLVAASLGKPSSYVPFMMPKRVAATDPNTQLNEPIGSGPFVFKRDAWRPGDIVVYTRNENYKPRAEPPSGHAGGKVPRVDRIEWRALSDPQTAVNALLAGEVDYIERPSFDLLPLLKGDSAIKTMVLNPLGLQFAFRPNHLSKPFDNPKVREALWYAFNQIDFLNAAIGDRAYFKPCLSLYPCGSPYADEAAVGDRLTANEKKAAQLLKEAGYDGTPVVLLHATDVSNLANMAPVAKRQMERAGFKVDMQSMDWQTLVSRRTKKEPWNAGGWGAFITSVIGVDLLDPIMHPYLASAGEKSSPGWPSDPDMESLRMRYAQETDAGVRADLAHRIQQRLLQFTQYIPLGQFYVPVAMRTSVEGALIAPTPVFWNLTVKR